MIKRITQLSLVGLLALMWMLFQTAFSAQTPVLAGSKAAIQQKTPPFHNPNAVVLDLEETIEEKWKADHAGQDILAIQRLIALLTGSAHDLNVRPTSQLASSAPTLGLFILYCSLRIPLTAIRG